jgi:peroxiredoxin
VTRPDPIVKKQTSPRLLVMALVGAGLVIFGGVAWILLPSWLSAERSDLTAVPAQVSYPAPELSLNDLQGNPASLADYRGQVVLVNNWATWCPPCKEEMPALQAFYEAHHKKNFTVVGIDAGESATAVRDFVGHYKLTFPVWIDPTLLATAAFRNPGLPSSYVIDASGTVRLVWAGGISQENLEKYVAPLLEE